MFCVSILILSSTSTKTLVSVKWKKEDQTLADILLKILYVWIIGNKPDTPDGPLAVESFHVSIW